MSNILFPIKQNNEFGEIKRDHTFIDDAVIESSFDQSGTSNQNLGQVMPKKRLRFAIAIVVITFFILVSRGFYLQIIRGEYYHQVAEENRIQTEMLIPSRGKIYDKFGNTLAENDPSFVLNMMISQIPKDENERSRVLNLISDLAGFQRTDLDLLITEFADLPFDNIPIKKGINYEPAMKLAIETAKLPGFSLSISSKRAYTTRSKSLSHVLGYTGKISSDEVNLVGDGYRRIDDIGKGGIEKWAEKSLRGTIGKIVREVDAWGRELNIVSKKDPLAGADVYLTIDLEMQTFIETRLTTIMKKANSQRASVVVLDPNTGAVLAMVSLPSFDSNQFSGGVEAGEYKALLDDQNKPLFPRAIAGEFPSGSTFKPFVAYAALNEGIINASSTFLSYGGLSIGVWFFPDWKAGGHGYTDVRKAIAESVNTFFYMIGGGFENFEGLGVERITQYAKKFGFGEKTGIDLPGEGTGFLPSKEWKETYKNERWYVGDTYHYAIGQGDLLVTPLQMALGTAIIANGGDKIKPHVIQAVDGGKNSEFLEDKWEPEDNIGPKNIQIVREGMRQTVTRGSAQSLQWLPEQVAGKTGTAQTAGDRPTHAWFTGFGPYQNPEIAMAVLVEEGGEGSYTATPLANEIFYWWFTNR
ncbi:MAG: penicillin-binding protein 2 [Patescibacteria group bacterium]